MADDTVTFTDGDPVEGADKIKVGGKSPGTVEDALNKGIATFERNKPKTQYQPFKW